MATIVGNIAVEGLATAGHERQHLAPAAHARHEFAAWFSLAVLLGLAVLAAPFFLGRVYVADDLGEFHLPLRQFYSEQLARGEAFDWMDSLFGGFYLTGEGQLGGYHPFHLVLYRALPLDAAFDLELLASYPLLFAGTTLFLWRWVRRLDAAIFGGLAFTFCGFNLLHLVHPNAVAVTTHLPWLLYMSEVALTRHGLRRIVSELAVGLLIASQLLLGYPQYVWFSLIVVTTFVCWRALVLRVRWQRIVCLSLYMALGATTAAVQLLPTIDALAGSIRGTVDAEFANTGALHPLNIVQLVAPYLFRTRVVGQNTHELGLYAGAVPLLLCVWLSTRRRSWGRLAPAIWGATILGGFALLLAMGDHGILYRLQSYLPVVNRFRFPCRAIVLVNLAISILAAAAISILLQRRQPADVREAPTASGDAPLLATVLVTACLAIAGPLLWPEFVAPWPLIWLGPLLFAVGATFVALSARGVRWSVAALAFFTVLDLCCYGMSYSVYGRTADLVDFVAQTPRPPSDMSLRVAAAERDGLRTGDRMLLAGARRIDGYAGLRPRKLLDYTTRSAQQVAGVGWLYNPPAAGAALPGEWKHVSPSVPRARLMTRVTQVSDVPALDTVITDEPLDLPASHLGTAKVVNDRPGRIVVETRAATRQLLVTTESFHAGWQAHVDDRTQPVVRVNRDFLGCLVEPGRHRVELVFRPWSLQAGKIVSVCGLGLMVCVFCLRSRNVSRMLQPH